MKNLLISPIIQLISIMILSFITLISPHTFKRDYLKYIKMVTEMTAQQPTMRPGPGDFNCCYWQTVSSMHEGSQESLSETSAFSPWCIILLIFLILISIMLFIFFSSLYLCCFFHLSDLLPLAQFWNKPHKFSSILDLDSP